MRMRRKRDEMRKSFHLAQGQERASYTRWRPMHSGAVKYTCLLPLEELEVMTPPHECRGFSSNVSDPSVRKALTRYYEFAFGKQAAEVATTTSIDVAPNSFPTPSKACSSNADGRMSSELIMEAVYSFRVIRSTVALVVSSRQVCIGFPCHCQEILHNR